MKKFSDFAQNYDFHILDGKKKVLQDVLNRPVCIIGYRVKDTKYPGKSGKHCITIQFKFLDDENDKENHAIFTGSEVLFDQLETVKNELPFEAVIKKIGKYFTFS
jgi:hypothetical protein